VIAQPDHVASRWPIARIVGRKVAKALHCGLEKKLLDLIRFRVSRMNGCAYCLDMHWKDLRAEGETEQRMYSLDAGRETPYYSERERAALA
jgi:AhpD family alkylhydroperoxidase